MRGHLAARDPRDSNAASGWMRARVIPANGDGRCGIVRVVAFTPYAAETIADDALRAGRGAQLELEVSDDAAASGMAAIAERFALLGARGIKVNVHRMSVSGPGLGGWLPTPASAAG